jgi:hypothetical protein
MNKRNSRTSRASILSLLFFVFLICVSFSISLFLPSEISFKKTIMDGRFDEAKDIFPSWGVIAEARSLNGYYEKQQYDELESQIISAENEYCLMDFDTIPSPCDRIFYLHGLNRYQLGKNADKEEKRTLYEQAIRDFQKVMAMTDENSQEYIWAKENIGFLLNDFTQETQSQQNNSKGQDDQQNDNQNTQEDSDQGKAESEGQKNNEKQEGEAERNDQADQNTEGEESREEPGDSSRLPQEMQEAMEKVQQQLEKEGQEGFNRSASAAQKNNLKQQDPFDMMRNDPFFKQFFGNDPFFQGTMREPEFEQSIQDPNVKDW